MIHRSRTGALPESEVRPNVNDQLTVRPGARIGQGRTAEVFAWGNDRALKLYHAGWPATAAEA